MKVILLTVAAIPLLLLGMIASSTFVVVDVNPADGPHLVVPVPLSLAQTALSFAPTEVRRIEIPEFSEYSELVHELVHEIRTIPDSILVEVEDGKDHVLIEKIGDELSVSVRGGDDELVDVHIPLDMLEEVVESYDGETLELRHVLRSIGSVSHQDLVHVRDGDDEVKVWIW